MKTMISCPRRFVARLAAPLPGLVFTALPTKTSIVLMCMLITVPEATPETTDDTVKMPVGKVVVNNVKVVCDSLGSAVYGTVGEQGSLSNTFGGKMQVQVEIEGDVNGRKTTSTVFGPDVRQLRNITLFKTSIGVPLLKKKMDKDVWSSALPCFVDDAIPTLVPSSDLQKTILEKAWIDEEFRKAAKMVEKYRDQIQGGDVGPLNDLANIIHPEAHRTLLKLQAAANPQISELASAALASWQELRDAAIATQPKTEPSENTPLVHQDVQGPSGQLAALLAQARRQDGGQSDVIDAAVSGDYKKVFRMINKSPELINARDLINKSSLLMVSAEAGQTEIVKELLRRGAPLDTKRRDGCTALILASAAGKKSTVDMLLAGKADVNAVTNDGDTALSMAILFGHKDVAQALLKSKADTVEKIRGQSLVELAIEKNDADMVGILRKHGAK
ncbi:MAG: ankyrin repeat domain-containing protein [Verrucomicrobia bacterium]|nr:ankyrin repeat domain-containing protein [Verrucomicrobiota bacterium]